MSDGINLHQIGVQTNFKIWERFNLDVLSADGAKLFEYLIFHCQHHAEWTHSDKNLEYELGIGRRRLEALRTLFTELGILQTRIVRDPSDNRIRAYRINFTQLTKLATLQQLYRHQDTKGHPIDLNLYAQVYKKLAALQPANPVPNARNTAQRPVGTNHDEESVKAIADKLVTVFDQRRAYYNEEMKATSTGKTFQLAVGTVKFGSKHRRRLTSALQVIGDVKYIQDAFFAFCDTLNALTNSPTTEQRFLLPESPRDPLAYFFGSPTTRNGSPSTYQEFSVIHSFGNFFAAQYRGRSK